LTKKKKDGRSTKSRNRGKNREAGARARIKSKILYLDLANNFLMIV